MNNIISRIQTKFPNRQISLIYDIGDADPDIVVVEDWTFFQFSALPSLKTIVVVTSVEDYIGWRRMLRNFDVSRIAVYIIIENQIDDDKKSLVNRLIEQDKQSGIKFIR
ncbi:MAG: hypothetical protein K2L46_03030 [Paramuribaculum sp.]|nr:hypothetical protein [Paramuribaculum sp.]MDE6488231.1 hypothetical protein [Paramuribaculum sp.]